MSYYEFTLLLVDNIYAYILSLIFVCVLYYYLFRKKIISLFDPFTMSVLGSAMGCSIVIFIFVTGEISSYYFLQYSFSQLAFFLGFFLFNNTKLKLQYSDNNPFKISSRYFYAYSVISLIYIISNLIIYYAVGIPVFSEFRLASVGVGGGFGVINRLIHVYNPISVYFSLCFYFSKKIKFKRFSVFILVCNLIIIILSGSKSAFLGLIQGIFLFFLLNRQHFGYHLFMLKKKQKLLFIIAGGMAIVTIILQTNSNLFSSFASLMFRIVSYGDVYYLSYPNQIIESVSKTNIFIVVFGDLLRTLRLLPKELAPPGIGFEIYNLANGTIDSIAGPNPRHNIYGYVNFGFWGCLPFSFICGCVLNFVRRLFLTSYRSTQFRKILVLIIYLNVVSIETDPPASIMYMNNLLLLFPVFLIFDFFFVKSATFAKLDRS